MPEELKIAVLGSHQRVIDKSGVFLFRRPKESLLQILRLVINPTNHIVQRW